MSWTGQRFHISLLSNGVAAGGSIFATAGAGGVRGYDALSSAIGKDVMKGVAMGNPNDQGAFTGMPRSARAEIGIGYLAGYGEVIKVKFPLM